MRADQQYPPNARKASRRHAPVRRAKRPRGHHLAGRRTAEQVTADHVNRQLARAALWQSVGAEVARGDYSRALSALRVIGRAGRHMRFSAPVRPVYYGSYTEWKNATT